jgi:hypothetical protein
MDTFDYSAPAELFRRKTKANSRSLYRRFDTAAAAIGFAVEGMSDLSLLMTTLQVDEQRLDGRAIRDLYDAGEYPLRRKDAPALTRQAS